MSNLVETITNEEEGLVLRIYCHEDADLDWVLDDDEGPQIYYKHRRYRLGQHEIDPMNFGSEEELIQWLKDEKGAKTVYLVTNPSPHLMTNVDTLICIDTGPEIITGSTRMKAGTATKMILNMISTTTMIKLGKVYGNLMVDLMAVNRKLIDRGTRIIMPVSYTHLTLPTKRIV